MRIVEPTIINNATLTSSDVTEADYAAWLVGTTYAIEARVIYVNPSATVTITIAAPGVVTWTAHGFEDGQVVIFTTTDTLPTGITSGVAYWVIEKTTNTFQIATTKDGAPIVTTGSQAGTHTGTASIHLIFESLVASNVGNTPISSPTKWIQVGSTNRWKMFDASVSSRTSNADTVDVTLDVIGQVTAMACLNVSAATVQVIMTDAIDGEVYNSTVNLTSTSGITSWWSWFFKPIVRKRNYLFDDLPTYRDATIRVIVTDTGNMSEIGALVPGVITDFGYTQYGMSLGIIDFSVKQTDDFGNTTIVQRGYKKRSSLTTLIENNDVDNVINTLADLRATPIVFQGSSSFGASLIYGFYRDFDVVVSYPTASLLDIEIEGLT